MSLLFKVIFTLFKSLLWWSMTHTQKSAWNINVLPNELWQREHTCVTNPEVKKQIFPASHRPLLPPARHYFLPVKVPTLLTFTRFRFKYASLYTGVLFCLLSTWCKQLYSVNSCAWLLSLNIMIVKFIWDGCRNAVHSSPLPSSITLWEYTAIDLYTSWEFELFPFLSLQIILSISF